MNKSNIVKVGHAKVREYTENGVYAATYIFDKRRVQYDRSGDVCGEVPFSQTLILLKLPGTDRKIWIQAHERKRILAALEEMDPLGSAPRGHQARPVQTTLTVAEGSR